MGCLFCRIAAGEVPSTQVFESDDVLAFRDIHPVAPTHLLVIPKRHIPALSSTDTTDVPTLGRLLDAAREVAEAEGLSESGYRVVINNGRDANQTVDHLHVHVVGGRPLRWPPG